MAASDDIVRQLLSHPHGGIPLHAIEQHVDDHAAAVCIRRRFLEDHVGVPLQDIPHADYRDYTRVHGVHCENVIGYTPVPLGIVGPLRLDGRTYHVPMATTEGALVASTSRGLKALARGATSVLLGDGITRAPVFRASSLDALQRATRWIDSNLPALQDAFASTSAHLALASVTTRACGRLLFVRFTAATGNAMGMNMVTKAADRAAAAITRSLPSDLALVAVSGNYCADKKASNAGVNLHGGRGKSVIVEAEIDCETLSRVLHVSADQVVGLVNAKCAVGSALAGVAPSGCNAQAANVVAAIFLATGQDLGHIGTSSAAMTQAEKTPNGGLLISVTMPSIECGTVGGGTRLSAQAAAINIINAGSAQTLARVIAATVLAAELSLLAALCSPGALTHAHMSLNRPQPAE